VLPFLFRSLLRRKDLIFFGECKIWPFSIIKYIFWLFTSPKQEKSFKWYVEKSVRISSRCTVGFLSSFDPLSFSLSAFFFTLFLSLLLLLLLCYTFFNFFFWEINSMFHIYLLCQNLNRYTKREHGKNLILLFKEQKL
jgi:hypothetical protein